ncbi:MAG: hypothetical protein DMF63_13315 [Acidobacteria bacterium]|nr:MAG: hypothetical protein DMF63_13315 [Acidobacteriota bacterium]
MRRKLITSGLIVYIAVLLTQPCQDFHSAYSGEADRITAVAISVQTHSDDETGSETCSPFCVCGCCGMSVVNTACTTTAITIISTRARQTAPSTYRTPPANSYIDSIWQPPKV